jgi:hypothetical protein
MALADTGTPDRIWLCMADSNRTRVVSRALAKGLGMTVYMGPTMDEEGPVALVVADDAHAARIAEAKGNAAPGQTSLLVTAAARRAGADVFLDHDTDAGTLTNAIEGLKAWRDYTLAVPEAQDVGRGAMTALSDGEFAVQTPAQARDVALFIARACPQPRPVAVGLYVLMANGIEHGNLEFDTTEKAKGLADGSWARKLAARIADPAYADRRVRVRFHRGVRAISVLVQDDGPGIDAETAEMANPARAGYRGKTAKLARSLGFTQVNWLGTGNTVEAAILLPDPDEAPRRAAG